MLFLLLVVSMCTGMYDVKAVGADEMISSSTMKTTATTYNSAYDYGTNNDKEESDLHLYPQDKPVYKNNTREVYLKEAKIRKIKKPFKFEKRKMYLAKFAVTAVGGIITLVMVIGLLLCYRSLCKRKRRPVLSEDAVPALSPNPYSIELNPQST